MNAKNLLPLTAAVVFALCAGSMVISATHADNNHNAAQANAIVDLPTVTVTPDAAAAPRPEAARAAPAPAAAPRPANSPISLIQFF